MSATLSVTLVTLADMAAAAATKPVRRMPSIFVGHGSPMNALQSNAFTRTLQKWGKDIGQPTAILVVSAHWLTPNEIKITAESQPKTIHDFGGFPKALFEMQYPAPGAPQFAKQAARLLVSRSAKTAEDWGLDHGAWAVLHFLYPKADVPVFQVSIDYAQGGNYHLAVGRELSALRNQGVLILASGNVVHNLRHLDMGAPDGLMASRPWAQSFDSAVKAGHCRPTIPRHWRTTSVWTQAPSWPRKRPITIGPCFTLWVPRSMEKPQSSSTRASSLAPSACAVCSGGKRE